MQEITHDAWSGILTTSQSQGNGADIAGWRHWFATVQRDFELAMEKLQSAIIMDPQHASEGFRETLDAAKWQHSRFSAALQAYNLFCEASIRKA